MSVNVSERKGVRVKASKASLSERTRAHESKAKASSKARLGVYETE